MPLPLRCARYGGNYQSFTHLVKNPCHLNFYRNSICNLFCNAKKSQWKPPKNVSVCSIVFFQKSDIAKKIWVATLLIWHSDGVLAAAHAKALKERANIPSERNGSHPLMYRHEFTPHFRGRAEFWKTILSVYGASKRTSKHRVVIGYTVKSLSSKLKNNFLQASKASKWWSGEWKNEQMKWSKVMVITYNLYQ